MSTSLEDWRSALRSAEAAERELEAGGDSTALAADQALRQELRSLAPTTLPPALRQRILSQASARSPWPRWLALAAAAGLAMVFVLIHQPADHPATPALVDRDDLLALQLALATLDDSARRVGHIAGQELAAHLRLPMPEFDQLPYGPELRYWLSPAPLGDREPALPTL